MSWFVYVSRPMDTSLAIIRQARNVNADLTSFFHTNASVHRVQSFFFARGLPLVHRNRSSVIISSLNCPWQMRLFAP